MRWISQSQAQFYQEIVWHRKNTPAIDARYLFNTTERIYWLCKDKPNVYKNQVPKDYRSDVWTVLADKNNQHPAPFPVEIAENCILLTTQPGEMVYDPYTGSGTTLLAAEQNGRNSMGTEIDPAYIAMAHQRLQNPVNSLFNKP